MYHHEMLVTLTQLEFPQQDLNWRQNTNAISIRVCGILKSARDSNVTVEKKGASRSKPKLTGSEAH